MARGSAPLKSTGSSQMSEGLRSSPVTVSAKAIDLPSGARLNEVNGPRPSTSRTSSPDPSARAAARPSRRDVRSTKMTCRPDGDHRGCAEEMNGVEVTRLRWPRAVS